jgi:hypothetical protein
VKQGIGGWSLAVEVNLMAKLSNVFWLQATFSFKSVCIGEDRGLWGNEILDRVSCSQSLGKLFFWRRDCGFVLEACVM